MRPRNNAGCRFGGRSAPRRTGLRAWSGRAGRGWQGRTGEDRGGMIPDLSPDLLPDLSPPLSPDLSPDLPPRLSVAPRHASRPCRSPRRRPPSPSLPACQSLSPLCLRPPVRVRGSMEGRGLPSPSPPAIAVPGAPHPVAPVRRLRTAPPGGRFGATSDNRLEHKLAWWHTGGPSASPGRRKP